MFLCLSYPYLDVPGFRLRRPESKSKASVISAQARYPNPATSKSTNSMRSVVDQRECRTISSGERSASAASGAKPAPGTLRYALPNLHDAISTEIRLVRHSAPVPLSSMIWWCRPDSCWGGSIGRERIQNGILCLVVE